MKKIGFVDYYLSEWHANEYPAWIKAANESLGLDFELAYAWAEEEISPIDKISTDKWCEKFGATKCNTIDELCEKSDYIIVLAPSNPEKHLEYAKKVLPYKKPTYIDKTFVQNIDEANEIFEIAKANDTKFFSTSALRFADELKDFTNPDNIIITGGGGNFHEYMIHTIEMAVILLNSRAAKVKVEKLANERICRISTQDNKQAAIIYAPSYGFIASGINEGGRSITRPIKSEFFVTLIKNILAFFNSNTLPFDSNQTLEVIRVRDALIKAEEFENEWIEV